MRTEQETRLAALPEVQDLVLRLAMTVLQAIATLDIETLRVAAARVARILGTF